MADGGEGSSSASSARHQSFEQFVSQFAARASVQDFSGHNGAGESGPPMAAPESSNLKPTATEFFPRFPRHNLRDQDQSNGHSDARSEERAKGAIRRQYDGSKWNNGRRNNRNGIRNGFGRNRESNSNNYRDMREGDDEGRFYEGSSYSDRRDLGNGFRPHQQNRPFQQNGRWKPKSDNRHGGGRNGRDQRQEQGYYNGQFNTNREAHKEIEMKERRPNGYQRNRARLDKLEARILSKCSQREKLTRELESSKLECLVCCELVRPAQPIWSCPNCYHVLHLNCTTKWASSSKSDEGWRCPACQNITQKIPREYYCFCGKQKNPQYNRTDVAHSCGELCAREELCEHACTLLCHPGPCPPCQAMVQRSCGCGRSVKPMQCSQKEEIMCESICEKPLNCGIHSCQQKCHSGECNECAETLEHECHCGKEKKNVSCNVINLDNTRFCCGKVCQASLDCKNHECTSICHKGPCGKCALSPEMVTSCPCGKQAVACDERLTCLDPIPLCKGICGKQLTCGNPGSRHLCTARCHLGQCSACNKSTVVKCRCGHMDQQIKCKELESRGAGIKCKKRCTKMRSCGKHKCNQECCIDIDHICQKTCSQMLSCGRHRCDKPCHKGSCSACHRTSFDELTCECGASVIFPPVPCGTKKPLCDKPCTRSHRCTHPVLHNCHSEPDCPPCVVLTSQFCYGKHEQRKTIPCYQDSFSCGLPCSKPLPCGRHKCIKPCHENECFTEGAICKQSCTTTRTSCPHQCKAPCHDGECPTDLPCKEMVEVQCECGNRKQMRTCYDFSKEYRRITSAQLASSMLEMQRGGSVELSDIIGPVKPKNNKTLECSEECRQLERNRRLAIGLQIRNPDVSAKLQPNYSEFLKTFARKDPALIKMIHEKLSELVKLAKESKQKSRSYSFPVMNREKRHVVHEMCAMFGIESVAYDAEPNRNVVATADRFKSWLPSMSLLEVLQRENGQRRVIVPNLNAWGRTANSTK